MEEQPKKRQLNETQLKALAAGRLKALETRRKQREVRQAEMMEKKKALDEKFEAIVSKKKQQKEEMEETDKDIYPSKHQQEEPSSEEEPEPAPKSKKTSKPKGQKINLNIDDLTTPQEPNYQLS